VSPVRGTGLGGRALVGGRQSERIGQRTHQAQVFDALRRFKAELESGAIIVVEQFRARVRILPLPGSK